MGYDIVHIDGDEELLAQQLDEAKGRLQSARFKENKEAAQVKATKDELELVIKEFDRLKEQKKNLSVSLKRQEELLQSAQVEVREVEEQISTIENTSPRSDHLVVDLKDSLEQLEVVKEDLVSFDPFA